MPAYLSPILNDQACDANGAPLSGGKVYAYAAGTSTPIATYTDADGLTPQSNPIILNTAGRPDYPIWLPAGQAVKLVLKTSAEVLVDDWDNVTGVGDPTNAAAVDQWVTFTGTPTYISATSFSVGGDQTGVFQVRRRLRTANTGGVVYSSVSASSYDPGSGLTTVTVANDSGSLDAGLSQVAYGLLSATNSAMPQVYRSHSSVKGLTGANNAATPTTKLDLAADAVTLRDSSGDTVTRYNTGSITCDFGLAGPSANGRDQAGAFSANSWVYVYFVWNGADLATVASTQLPATGPSLPAGYTHWAFATAVRWNGSSNIQTCYVRGSSVHVGRISALASGTATSATAISLSSAVPPNALQAAILATLLNATAGAGQYALNLYATSGGLNLATASIGVNAASGLARDSLAVDIPNVSQTVYYTVSSTAVQAVVDVLGYSVPNGDV